MFRTGILMSGIFAAIILISSTQTKAQLDPTFGTNGISTVVRPSQQLAIATFALPDGKILVVVENAPFHKLYEFTRFNADGSLDTTYGSGGTVQLPIPFITNFGSYGIFAAARQPDGKIVLVGEDDNKGLTLRFNDDGTLDSSFAGSGVIRQNIYDNTTDSINTVLVQPDGKILVGGITGSPRAMFFIRYNPDGTPDNGFGVAAGIVVYSIFTEGPTVMVSQSSGKFLTLQQSKMYRFNADGTFDHAFPVSTTQYSAIAVQPDDKIIAASIIPKAESFDRSNYDPVIFRFNSDGTVDTGFGTAGSLTFDWARYIFEYVSAINVLSDGRILLSGSSDIPPNRTKYKESSGTVALLSSTGSINGKFLIQGFRGPATPSGSAKNNVAIFPDGRILFGGIKAGYFSGPDTYDLQLAQIIGVPTESYLFKPAPFDFKLSYDGASDWVIFRPSTLTWHWGGKFGLPGDILVPADYMHKGYDTEIAVFRPSNGTWYISPYANSGPTDITAVQWGLDGDIPVPADFDGDVKADLAVFRPSTGAWYIRNSADNSVTGLYWGLNGDKPVPGDYDGDGRDDIAVFRPSNGTWYIIRSTAGLLFTNFGLNGDVPVQDDYDGDGKTDIAVWRPSTGVWYRINSSDNSIDGMAWGLPDDLPAPGDYDGDSKTDIAVWRPNPSGPQALWYIYKSSSSEMWVFPYGLSTDIPVAARH